MEIVAALPPFVQAVAVTVDATREFSNLGWRKQLKHFNLAQLHGHESPVHCHAVGKYLPVIKALPADSSLFRLPKNMIETIDKLKDVQKGLAKNLGREPTLEEISDKIDVPVERVRAVLRTGQKSEFLEPREENGSPSLFAACEYATIISAFLLDTPSPKHGGTGRAFDWNVATKFKMHARKPVILSGGLTPENVARAIEAVQPYAVDVSSGVESSPGRKDHARLRDFIRICKKF